MIDQRIQEKMCELPILESAVVPADQVPFLERVRYICRECPQYGTTWSCPPAVGTVEECMTRCSAYQNCFVFSTIAEVSDITNMEETLATRVDHEAVTDEMQKMFRQVYGDVLTLSTESCTICENCAYPDAPCRHPERMHPCVESYGIVVARLAEQAGMTFDNGANVVTWFSVIFYNEGKTDV